ncbi:unnamed protein product [Somion occarium]|uniref:Uncharacterized protein n=1 Tax=Somion occarium TaxID=3059160 RepID=A0ABP1EDX2_9APHY
MPCFDAVDFVINWFSHSSAEFWIFTETAGLRSSRKSAMRRGTDTDSSLQCNGLRNARVRWATLTSETPSRMDLSNLSFIHIVVSYHKMTRPHVRYPPAPNCLSAGFPVALSAVWDGFIQVFAFVDVRMSWQSGLYEWAHVVF